MSQLSASDLSAGCDILHVDMDAFYASVATRDRPELAEVPVIVGGGDRGVVLSANYLARDYGVRSAMPMTRARRLCRDAVIINPDYDTFTAVSTAVMEVFRRVTPAVQALSLDEAFLDVSGIRCSPLEIAQRIRAIVHDEQRIACSVGVAPTSSVAKIASRRAKPDGVVVVAPHDVVAFLHPLDVGELYGVGEKTQAALHRLGIFTVGDLAQLPRDTLCRAMGEALGRQLHHLAWGIDGRRITASFGHGDHDPEKSMGADETFARDTDDRDVIARELLRLSAKVGQRLRTAGAAGRTITIRIRFADFTTITRSKTLPEAVDGTQEIYRCALRLFDALGLQRARIRLVGVRVEGLMPRARAERQLVLGQRDQGWAEADRVADAAVRRFGQSAVRPASLVGPRRVSPGLRPPTGVNQAARELGS